RLAAPGAGPRRDFPIVMATRGRPARGLEPVAGGSRSAGRALRLSALTRRRRAVEVREAPGPDRGAGGWAAGFARRPHRPQHHAPARTRDRPDGPAVALRLRATPAAAVVSQADRLTIGRPKKGPGRARLRMVTPLGGGGIYF